MFLNYLSRFRQGYAILAFLLILNFSAQAATSEFASFSVNCKGVLSDVIAKGYSPLVIGFAQDKNGNDLYDADDPSVYETFTGSTLLVPKEVLNGHHLKPEYVQEGRARYAAIAAAHDARRKSIGAKKYDAAAKKCEEALNPPQVSKPTVRSMGFKYNLPDNLAVGQKLTLYPYAFMSDGSKEDVRFAATSSNPDVLKVVQKDGVVTITAMSPGDAELVITPLGTDGKPMNGLSNHRPFTVEASPDAGISAWWLLLLLLIPIAAVVAWMISSRRRAPENVEALNRLQNDVIRMAAERDAALQQLAELTASWNNMEELHARINELANEPQGPHPIR